MNILDRIIETKRAEVLQLKLTGVERIDREALVPSHSMSTSSLRPNNMKRVGRPSSLS